MNKLFKFIMATALTLCLLVGCAAAPQKPAEDATIRLASLKGPTTMGLVKLLHDTQENDGKSASGGYTLANEIHGTADEITALLVNKEIDMAAIPCNLASVLYSKTGGDIKVAAVNTLGVLYVVEAGDSVKSVADLAGKNIYSTGKGTTPEYVLNAILSWNKLDPASDVNVEYKSEATEIAALLSEGNGAIAVLPQPYVTSVLMQNKDTRIALDLTKEWKNSGNGGSLVTGVLVVRGEFAQQHPDAVAAFLSDYETSVEWVNANPSDSAALIESYGIVAKADIAQQALPYCNIVFETGKQMKTDVSSYLDVLFKQNPKAVGGSMPNDDFYYEA
ncbi:MAG: MqnA/MqnD/SBP family protein [Oscillospiraceae bacterium]